MDAKAMHVLRDALVADDFEFPSDTYTTRNPQINRHFAPFKRSSTMPKMGGKASQKVGKTGNTADGFEDGGKKKMIKRMTNTRRAGLEFPVGRIVRKIRDVAGKQQRVSVTAGVYAASILEYLVAEVIELAGNAAKDLKTKRISPRHLYLAMHGDEEVEKLVKTVIIAGGGVVPLIHPGLIPKGRGQKQPVKQNIVGEQSSG